MLLVIALVAATGLVAAAVLTGGMEGMRLRATGKDIATALRYTRTTAIASGTPQRFTIDPVARRWQAPGGRHGEVPPSLTIRFTGAREVQPRQGVGAIQFFEDGASTGGRIDLRAGQAGWRIDVGWILGDVSSGRTPDGALR
ncbi:MAG TPA: type II secretion system protein GspH [Xanthomonadaceae bacterium]|nr:type II secretion system protein GspH [Xanthomonadaceae bacterium]